MWGATSWTFDGQREVCEEQDAVDGLVLQRDVDLARIERDGRSADSAQLDALPAPRRTHLPALPVGGRLDVSVAAIRYESGGREAEQKLQAAWLHERLRWRQQRVDRIKRDLGIARNPEQRLEIRDRPGERGDEARAGRTAAGRAGAHRVDGFACGDQRAREMQLDLHAALSSLFDFRRPFAHVSRHRNRGPRTKPRIRWSRRARWSAEPAKAANNHAAKKIPAAFRLIARIIVVSSDAEWSCFGRLLRKCPL